MVLTATAIFFESVYTPIPDRSLAQGSTAEFMIADFISLCLTILLEDYNNEQMIIVFDIYYFFNFTIY